MSRLSEKSWVCWKIFHCTVVHTYRKLTVISDCAWRDLGKRRVRKKYTSKKMKNGETHVDPRRYVMQKKRQCIMTESWMEGDKGKSHNWKKNPINSLWRLKDEINKTRVKLKRAREREGGEGGVKSALSIFMAEGSWKKNRWGERKCGKQKVGWCRPMEGWWWWFLPFSATSHSTAQEAAPKTLDASRLETSREEIFFCFKRERRFWRIGDVHLLYPTF